MKIFSPQKKVSKKGIIYKVNWIQVSMAKYLINGHSRRFSKFFLFPNIRTFCSRFPAYNKSRLKTRYKQISPFLEYFILCFQSLPNLPFLAIFPLDRFCLPWQRFIGKRLATHSTLGRKQRDKHDIEDVTPKKWQENNTKLHFSLIMQTKNVLVLSKGFVRTHARRAPFPARPEYIFLLRLFEKIFSDHSKASLVIRGR